jgi:hypothetical protein
MRKRLLTLLVSASAVLFCVTAVAAQTQFASFTGTITSTDGNPIPNVEVTATNQATQVPYTATSNDEGLYTITALPIGTYKVQAQSQNFRPFETNPIA